MTDHDLFEPVIDDALRAYAAEAPIQVDALAFAHAIVVDHPRQSRWSATFGSRRQPTTLAWLLVGALILVGSALALAAVGSLRTSRVELSVESRFPIPYALYGEWQADVPEAGPNVPAGRYTIDMHAPDLVRGPGGMAAGWAGRAVAFVPASDAVDVVVRSAGSCGEGRYALRPVGVEVEPGLPSAAPAVSSRPGEDPLAGLLIETETIRFTRLSDDCADRIAILTASPWTWAPLTGPHRDVFSGETSDSGTFTEPFRFTVGLRLPSGGSTIPGSFRTAMRYVSDGGLRFGGPYGSMALIDDLPMASDICDASSTVMADIPSTPEAVGEWLRSSPGLRVSEPTEIPVDGRTALRFDIDSEACTRTRLPLGGFTGYLMRAYAIPTGDDTILLVGGSDDVDYEGVKELMDAFVRSMDFR